MEWVVVPLSLEVFKKGLDVALSVMVVDKPS